MHIGHTISSEDSLVRVAFTTLAEVDGLKRLSVETKIVNRDVQYVVFDCETGEHLKFNYLDSAIERYNSIKPPNEEWVLMYREEIGGEQKLQLLDVPSDEKSAIKYATREFPHRFYLVAKKTKTVIKQF